MTLDGLEQCPDSCERKGCSKRCNYWKFHRDEPVHRCFSHVAEVLSKRNSRKSKRSPEPHGDLPGPVEERGEIPEFDIDVVEPTPETVNHVPGQKTLSFDELLEYYERTKTTSLSLSFQEIQRVELLAKEFFQKRDYEMEQLLRGLLVHSSRLKVAEERAEKESSARRALELQLDKLQSYTKLVEKVLRDTEEVLRKKNEDYAAVCGDNDRLVEQQAQDSLLMRSRGEQLEALLQEQRKNAEEKEFQEKKIKGLESTIQEERGRVANLLEEIYSPPSTVASKISSDVNNRDLREWVEKMEGYGAPFQRKDLGPDTNAYLYILMEARKRGLLVFGPGLDRMTEKEVDRRRAEMNNILNSLVGYR